MICVVILLLFCRAPHGIADDFHYVNTIVGNRASGVAGAYAALSDDPAGCYYNPAGIAFAPNLSLSASMNAFSSSSKTYKDVLTGASGGTEDWEQVSSSLLPNFFGIVRKFGNGMLGVSYAVPDSIQRRQKQLFQNIASTDSGNPVSSYIININDMDKTYLFGPSYAYALSDALSIGATAYIYYRDREIIRNQLLQFYQGEHILMNYYETLKNWGVKPIIGIMYEPLDKMALGLTLSRIIILSNDTQQQDIYRNTVADDPVTVDSREYDFSDTHAIHFKSRDFSDTDDFPFSISLGAAYFVSPKLLYSLDVTFNTEVSDKESVFNLNLGTEYYFRDSLAMRCGFYTDNANTPDLSSDSVNQDEHIDIYGMSLSFTLFQRMSSMTIGISYGFGSGEAQMISNVAEVQDMTVQNVTCYLSASYNY